MDLRTESGGEPDLPEIPAECSHIVSLLFEIGPTSAGGMGTIPLTWVDIATWQRLIGVELPPWQARLLRRMSGEYLESYHAAEKQDAPPPWQPLSDDARRARIANHVRSFLRGSPR
jgi:hypothetical protein